MLIPPYVINRLEREGKELTSKNVFEPYADLGLSERAPDMCDSHIALPVC